MHIYKYNKKQEKRISLVPLFRQFHSKQNAHSAGVSAMDGGNFQHIYFGEFAQKYGE